MFWDALSPGISDHKGSHFINSILMRAELKRLQRRSGITTIFVTHDQVEAMTMADKVALLKSGELQCGKKWWCS